MDIEKVLELVDFLNSNLEFIFISKEVPIKIEKVEEKIYKIYLKTISDDLYLIKDYNITFYSNKEFKNVIVKHKGIFYLFSTFPSWFWNGYYLLELKPI